jgi:hypothetical protein
VGIVQSTTAPAHAKTTTATSQTPLRLALNTATGTAIGLGLAAFYILPAAHQRRYVQIAMAIIPNMRIQDNFLFHHTGDAPHDQVLHTASIIAILLITTTTLVLTASFLQCNFTRRLKATAPEESGKDESSKELGKDASSRPNPERALRVEGGVERPPHFVSIRTTSLFASLAILTLAITLLLTPITNFIWTHAPELAFLQFPWRLVAILAAVLSLTIALALAPLNLKPAPTTALTLVIAAALTWPAYTLFHQTCDEEDTIPARLALFHSSQGADPTDEYTPVTADNDSLAHTNPPYWLAPDPNAKAPANTQPGPAPTHLPLNATTPENLILNLRDYPAWRITLNGTPITTHANRDDGLIAFLIPAGPSTIDVTHTQPIDEILGDVISLASLAILFFLIRRTPRSLR